MSWEEVKKINSDLSVPLNERITAESSAIRDRIECVSGIIPRGKTLKTVNVSVNDSYNLIVGERELLNIEGSGFLYEVTVKTQSNAGDRYGQVSISINDDLNIKVGDTVAITKNPTTASLSLNADKMMSDIDAHEKTIGIGQTDSLITNFPIAFEKLVANLKYACANTGITVIATISYILL